MKKSWVKNNDVLLNITGASIARVAKFSGEDYSANINQHVCILRSIPNLISPEYLSYFISIPTCQDKILSQNSGATTEAFNYKQIKEFIINVPTVDYQDKFKSIAEHLKILLKKQLKSQNKLETLFNSLIQKAFRGDLKFNDTAFAEMEEAVT